MRSEKITVHFYIFMLVVKLAQTLSFTHLVSPPIYRSVDCYTPFYLDYYYLNKIIYKLPIT